MIGPLVGMAVRPARAEHVHEGQIVFGPEPAHEHEHTHEHAVPFFPQRAGHAHDGPEGGADGHESEAGHGPEAGPRDDPEPGVR